MAAPPDKGPLPTVTGDGASPPPEPPADAAPSVRPWKAPWKANTSQPSLTRRALRMAASVASLPVVTRKALSMCGGVIWHSFLASRARGSVTKS